MVNLFFVIYQMETKETVLFILGVFLIVVIIGMLVKIYYVVEQHGLQISVLLKHEKEGFVPWRNRAVQQNLSSNYRNHLLPENKQIEPNRGNMLAINNQRAQRPCHALTTDQLNRYGAVLPNPGGLAQHAQKAEDLGITAEQSLKTGNMSSMDVDVQSNYVEDDGPAIDQTGIKQDEPVVDGDVGDYSGNPRVNPAFLKATTEGFKQAHESSMERFRKMRQSLGRPL